MRPSSKRFAAAIPFLIREAQPKDLAEVLRLSRMLDSINLPTTRKELARFLRQSRLSFRGKLPHRQEGVYLFVLEDQATARVVGTSLILAKHGTPESPHYYLETATDERYSKTLKKMFRHTYLTLRHSMDGPTEVGGFILDPAYRHHEAKAAKQLSFVRFLYIAMYRERFEDEVIAEMMPQLTPEGESPFWECYGKRVTGLSFREADKLSTKDKEFIEALFPPIPLYLCMLPPEVQASIGKVRPETQGAVHLLEKAGMRFLHHIDPFDGGPYYGGRVEELALVRAFRSCQVQEEPEPQASPDQDLLMGWEGRRGFCAARVLARVQDSTLFLPRRVLSALGFRRGPR